MKMLEKLLILKPRVKLFHKFLIGIGLASILPLALLGYFLIDKFQFALETPITELHLNLTENIKDRIEKEVERTDKRAMFLADIMAKMDWQSRQNALLSFLNSEPALKEVSLGNLKGGEALKINLTSEKSDELENISQQDYFKAATETGRRQIRILKDHDDIVLLYPFQTFFMKFVMKKSELFNSLNLSNVGSDGVVLILDSKKNVLASSSQFSGIEQAGDWPISEQALKNLSSAATSFKDSKGREYLGAYSYSPSIDAAIIVRQSRSDAYRYALSMKKEAILIILILAISVLPVAYFISRNMSGPIIKITEAAKKVSSGDFNHSVEVNTADELRDLAETFNDMIWQLKLYSEMQIEKILNERKNTQAVLFSTEDGIVMLDLQYNLQLINRMASSLLKIQGDVENKNFISLIKEEKLKDIFGDLLRDVAELPVREFEMDATSSKRVFRASLREITMPDKKEKSGYLIAIYDITLAKELERIKEEFLHSITHDLRNPMGAIKGFVEFMLKEIPGPLTEAQRKMLVSMDRAAFRLLGMVNNILDIAKMEAGKMDINLADTDMAEVARKSVELMESLAAKKKIAFEVLADSAYLISCDAQLMERVFINLIGNAIKFTPENGKIMIGMKKDREWFYAWVEDTGEGLPMDYVDRVFEKFEQVKGQKAGGTGLGLTICKHITRAHLGDIWAEQEAGKGARFVFKIPLGLKKYEDKVYVSR
ncbi:MAG: hypothetical protein Fur0012_05680 [Elusimicrobiota bacterium]